MIKGDNMVKVSIDNPTKPFWESKTFWTAVVAVLLGTLMWVQGQIDTGATITVMGVVMAILRSISKEGITFLK